MKNITLRGSTRQYILLAPKKCLIWAIKWIFIHRVIPLSVEWLLRRLEYQYQFCAFIIFLPMYQNLYEEKKSRMKINEPWFFFNTEVNSKSFFKDHVIHILFLISFNAKGPMASAEKIQLFEVQISFCKMNKTKSVFYTCNSQTDYPFQNNIKWMNVNLEKQ